MTDTTYAASPTPAHDDAAERAILGSVLIAGRPVLDRLADAGLRPDDFYTPRHETIYAAMLGLDGRGDPVDAVTVAAALTESGDLPKMGGAPVIHELMTGCPSPASAVHYARITAQASVRRRLGAAGMRVQGLAHPSAGSDITTLVDAAQAAVAEVADRLHGRAPTDDMSTLIDDVLAQIEDGEDPATPTGLTDLDQQLVGGLRPGTLTTVAARPGCGKTVIGLQVALSVARTGAQAGFTSLEMTRQDLMLRAVSALSSVDYGRLQRSPGEPLTGSEWTHIRKAAETIRDSGLTIAARTTSTVAAIRADIRHTIRTKGSCAVWIVDYLQLVSPADRKTPREQQVAAMTRSLKTTALETGVPIVILAQLNRDSEKGGGRPPVLTDLRESGAIEQDSDNVILLHRTEDAPDEIGIRVAKNRRGPQGDFTMKFEGAYQRVTAKKWTPHGMVGAA